MKEILLVFKTKKGVKAYEQSEEEGKSRPAWERRAVRCLFKDRVVSKDPLTVEIKIKSQRMALTVDLQKQIKDGLAKFGAVQNKDYTITIK